MYCSFCYDSCMKTMVDARGYPRTAALPAWFDLASKPNMLAVLMHLVMWQALNPVRDWIRYDVIVTRIRKKRWPWLISFLVWLTLKCWGEAFRVGADWKWSCLRDDDRRLRIDSRETHQVDTFRIPTYLIIWILVLQDFLFSSQSNHGLCRWKPAVVSQPTLGSKALVRCGCAHHWCCLFPSLHFNPRWKMFLFNLPSNSLVLKLPGSCRVDGRS